MVKAHSSERICIGSLDDITRRPGFVATVPPRRSLFRFALASYSFPRHIASCAVSDCFKNHKKGYLVYLADGSECSICATCAERFLDAAALRPQPARQRSALAPGVARPERSVAAESGGRQISVADYTRDSARIRAQVKALKQAEQGANWLFQSVSGFLKVCPEELLAALHALRQDPEAETVYAALFERNASDEQLQAVEQLQGLGVFAADIRELLVERVLKPLTALDAKAVKAGDGGSLSVALHWPQALEADLAAAEALIAAGRLFFTEANLQRLRSIPLSEPAEQVLRNLRWDCEAGAPTR